MLAAIAVVIAGGGGAFYYLKDHHDLRAVATTPATSHPSLAAPVANKPPANPFTGSPANSWADGADGVVSPSAGSRGPFSASQVRSAYAMTRDLVLAQNLDWPTLRGGPPVAFERMLPSWLRGQFVAWLSRTGLDKDGTQRSTRTYVTSFAPGTVERL